MRNPRGAKPELVKRANPPVEMIPKRDEVTVEQVVELLNQALAADDVAITELIQTRTACNEKLSKHSSIQVGLAPGCNPEDKKLLYEVGILGLLNGLFGVDDKQWGAIAAEMDPSGHVRRFVVREPWKGVFTEVDS